MQDSPEQIDATLRLHAETYDVQKTATGRCSGELTFLRVQQQWKDHSIYADLGETFTF